MNGVIPVVITHRGNQEYFQLVVRQALSYNERVILIGDESNKDTPGVEHYSGQELRTPAAEIFEDNYVHMHVKPNAAYRRANIIRWFLITELARQRNFPVVFACDSDVMLYTDVSVAEPSGVYDMACSIPSYQPEFRWSASGHVSYWKLDTLFEFCVFADYMYANPRMLKKLKTKWNWHQETGTPGGICDMTLLWLFIQNEPGVYIDLAALVRDTVFDHNFLTPGRWRMAGGAKDLEWRDGQPWGYHLDHKKRVRFNALHFQGSAKDILKRYFRPRSQQID